MAEIGTKWIIGNFVVIFVLIIIIYNMYTSRNSKSSFEKVVDYSARRIDKSKFMKDPDLLVGINSSKNQDNEDQNNESVDG
jgi:hypothetical protein